MSLSLLPLPARAQDPYVAAFDKLAAEYAVDFRVWADRNLEEASRLEALPLGQRTLLGVPRVTFGGTGEPTHVAFDGAPLRLDDAPTDPVLRARAALARVGDLWSGPNRPPAGLVHSRTYESPHGLTHVTFVQELDGVPLYQTRLTVHLAPDGNLRGVTGTYRPDATVVPRGDFLLGVDDVSFTLEEWFGSPATLRDIELYVEVPDNDPGRGTYVYRAWFEAEGEEYNGTLEAETGALLTVWPRYAAAKTLNVYDCHGQPCSPNPDNVYSYWSATHYCWNGGTYPNCVWTDDTDELTANLHSVWNMFWARWGHDQNAEEGGATLSAYADYSADGQTCYNAFANLEFCDETGKEPNIVTHEFTHRVIDIYHPEWGNTEFTGSLDEGFTDAFAEIEEQYATGQSNWCLDNPPGDPGDQPWRWLCLNPNGKNHPDHLNEFRDPLAGGPPGWSHFNNGILGSMAFLLAQDASDGGECDRNAFPPLNACDPDTITEYNVHWGVGVSSLVASYVDGKYRFGGILLEAMKGGYFDASTDIYDFRNGLMEAVVDLYGYGAAATDDFRNALLALGFYENKTNRVSEGGTLIGDAADTPVAVGIEATDNMFVAWRAVGSNSVYRRIFSPSSETWWAGSTVPSVSTDTAPAVAVYNNRIHLVYKEVGGTRFWHTHATTGGVDWSTPQRIEVAQGCGVTVESSFSPALTVFNGLLFLGYTHPTGGWIRYTTYNGTSWATCGSTTGRSSNDHPAIAATQNGLLWFVYKEAANQNVRYFSRTTGGTLGATQSVPFQAISQRNGQLAALIQTDRAPAAFVWMNRLYVAYYSPGNSAVRVVSCGGACDDAHLGEVDGVDYPDLDWMFVTELPAWTSRTPSLALDPYDNKLYVFFRSLTNSNVWMTRKGSNY